MSAPNGDGGSVQIYRSSTLASWSTLGDAITIGNASLWFGGTVELSGNGRVVAISDPIATSNAGADPVREAGMAVMFHYDAGTVTVNVISESYY